MRALAVAALVLTCGCATAGRLVRAIPYWNEGELPDAERVNLWPLFYRAGDLTVALWPLFDHDERGFALRPLLAREGAEWSLAWPLAGWNTETGAWWVLPAYSLRQSRGLFPLFHVGDWNHVGPAWWLRDASGEVSDWGVLPLFGVGAVDHVGPFWRFAGGEDEPPAWGVFPLAHVSEHAGWVLSAWWNAGEDGAWSEVGALPLFYWLAEGEHRRLITPLGGRGWGGDGERFVNVLGPVFHHSTDGEASYTALAWPLVAVERGPDRAGVRLFPLVNYRAGGRASLWDSLTLVGYRATTAARAAEGVELPREVALHLGTPLLFHYRRRGDDVDWGSVLNLLDYERTGDEARFSLLYYLYRQRRQGQQVRRDLFPFLTWDSGPERSGFSFLWRVLRWETVGGRTRGHFLFFPWGDHGGGAAEVR